MTVVSIIICDGQMLANRKKILFLTGTRADFGKLKSLINITSNSERFDAHIFVTGMHLQKKYGYTVREIEHSNYKNVHRYSNYCPTGSMDYSLAKTIEGLAEYVARLIPDLIVVHGDRVEALAGAIVGAFNNILVAHIEGGEVSGTIDELIRHAVSKLSHTHFVSNDPARKRLIQMGEIPQNIFVIGSPDVDAIVSKDLPHIEDARGRYEITFEKYAIALFHPVTTEISEMRICARNFVDALITTRTNYIVLYPNNDPGSSFIFTEYKRLRRKKEIKLYPSIRFEYFLTLLKNADFIVGNSSAGIREAPYYGVPTINVGTRQQNRSHNNDILHVGYSRDEICHAVDTVRHLKLTPVSLFGDGKSDQIFLSIISSVDFWTISKQKLFNEVTDIF